MHLIPRQKWRISWGSCWILPPGSSISRNISSSWSRKIQNHWTARPILPSSRKKQPRTTIATLGSQRSPKKTIVSTTSPEISKTTLKTSSMSPLRKSKRSPMKTISSMTASRRLRNRREEHSGIGILTKLLLPRRMTWSAQRNNSFHTAARMKIRSLLTQNYWILSTPTLKRSTKGSPSPTQGSWASLKAHPRWRGQTQSNSILVITTSSTQTLASILDWTQSQPSNPMRALWQNRSKLQLPA